MNNVKIMVIDTVHPLLLEILSTNNFDITAAYEWDKSKIKGEIMNYNGIIIRSRITIDQQIIDAAAQLKFIARFGAGMENIDVSYAQSKGIACLHAAEGNKDAVAEHALGMLLCLFNKINTADLEVRNYQWLREPNRGEELAGKTIGIIGYGNMGSAFAKRLQGFDVKVLVYDKYKNNYLKESDWLKESSLEQMHKEADIISLHTPLTSETNGMVNSNWLKLFHKPIYLINTARGKILNTSDALQMMKQNKVLGMCLDVLEYEDTSFEHINASHQNTTITELFNSPKVVLTPHIAGWSQQSNVKLAQVLANEILNCYNIAKN